MAADAKNALVWLTEIRHRPFTSAACGEERGKQGRRRTENNTSNW